MLAKAARLTVLLVAPVALGAWVGGSAAAVGMVMGVVGTLAPAVMVPRRAAAALVLPLALACGVAVAVADDPFAAAAFTTLSCLLIAPANVITNGLMAGLPTATAVLASIGGDLDPPGTALWVALGGAVVIAVVKRPPGAPRPPGVPERTAWIHAVLMGATVGASVYLVALWEVPHGYWVALTLTSVLRPIADQTHTLARQRSVMTVIGAMAALPLTALLPSWGLGIVAATLLVATLGYTMLGRAGQAVLASTPILVLASAGAAGDASEVASERIVATVIGAVVSLGAALLADRLDPQPDATADSAAEAPGPPA